MHFQKIPILVPWKGFVLHLPPGNSSLASYYASKILTPKASLPKEFPMTFHGVGVDFFLVELHILQIIVTKQKKVKHLDHLLLHVLHSQHHTAEDNLKVVMVNLHQSIEKFSFSKALLELPVSTVFLSPSET